MKDFKFRVWDNKKRQFVKGEYLPFISNLDGIYEFDKGFKNKTGCHSIMVNFIFQQYTGLFDKNNKQIYEGDIVKADPNHITLFLKNDEECPVYTKGEIKWLCEAWKVCQPEIGASYLSNYAMCDCCPCGLEIIGNIFENLELLNENK
jgi:uncharacterized phage protein (TIGR01671 family)